MAEKPTYESLRRRVEELERGTLHRKEAEEALRRSEEKYRSILESIEDGYYEVDLTGIFTFVNPSFCRIAGYSEKELLGTSYRAYTDSDVATRVYQIFNEVYRSGEPMKGFDWEMIRKDGTVRFIETSISRIEDLAGEPIGFRGVMRDVTDRKSAEKAVKESEERFRTLFENATLGIYKTAPDGRILMANPALIKMLGYASFEELASRNLEDGGFESDSPRSRFKELLARDGEVMGLEGAWKKSDGSMVYVRESARAVRGGDGEVLYYEGTAEDISERKQTEEALRESEEKYRLVVENANEAIFVAQDGMIRFFNPKTMDMIGYSEKEIKSKPFIEFIHPDDREFVLQRHIERLKGETPPTVYAFRIVDKDGNATWVQLSTELITWEKKPATLNFLTDISERKQVEEALQKQRAYFQQLFESSPEATVMLDAEDRILETNEAFERAFQYNIEEIRGKYINDVVVPPDLIEEATELSHTALRGELVEKETVRVRKDGRLVDVALLGYPIVVENDLAGVYGIYRDITERKRLEAQLLQSQKMEAIGRLAGGVAHDFNNVLTSISGYAELALLSADEKDPIRPNLEEIKKAGERAAALTRQLLTFSRKQILQPVVLDLNALIGDTEKMLRRLIGEDIALETVLKSEFGRVEADPGQMEQMVMNIAINARDAMPDGGTLTVETADAWLDDSASARHEVNLPPGEYVKLTIRDTGVGMDKATQSMIFEPFFTTKERGKGTGLGLSTVYGIVKQSGGAITVDSRPKCGTVFEILLPRVAEAQMPTATKSHYTLHLAGSETVLLVEDDEAVRRLTRGILDRYGYRVLEAGNPEEALAVYRGHRGSIDLLLTDVIMPGMSGRELAERVQSFQTNIKILYMSGYTGEAIARHGILEEGVEFIPKPFTPEGIAHKVREVLDGT